MRKRWIATVVCASVMSVLLSGCGAAKQAEAETAETTVQEETQAQEMNPDVILVTDSGSIDDKSFHQSIWEGIAKYGAENGLVCDCVQPVGPAKEELLAGIDEAVEKNAKLVVCAGSLFEEPVSQAQEQYPDTSFLVIDAVPHASESSDVAVSVNVLSIVFAEDQSGFLAGYAAVKEGHTKLGFLGGAPVESVVRYGYGFVQGADAAAAETGTKAEIHYHYTGSFAATPEAEAVAASWYQQGTEAVFSCGGSVLDSVVTAAKDTDSGLVIGVDCDQSKESDRILTSAMKQLETAVYDGVKSYFEGSFAGGTTIRYDAANQGVGLPMDTSLFQKFTGEDYDSLYQKLGDGSYELQETGAEISPEKLSLSNTEILYQ